MQISLVAPFKALPQGSKTAFVVKGRAVLTEAHKGLIPERKKLSAWIASKLENSGWVTPDKDTPLSVSLFFEFEKPKTVKRQHFTIRPDVDKLTRFAIDAIVQSGAILDDNQIVAIEAVKEYGSTDLIKIHLEVLS